MTCSKVKLQFSDGSVLNLEVYDMGDSPSYVVGQKIFGATVTEVSCSPLESSANGTNAPGKSAPNFPFF